MKIAGGFGIADMFPSQRWLHWISGMGPKLERNFRENDKLLDCIIDEHRAKRARMDQNGRSDCLLDVLLNLQANGDLDIPLEDKNIKANIVVSMLDMLFISSLKKHKYLFLHTYFILENKRELCETLISTGIYL